MGKLYETAVIAYTVLAGLKDGVVQCAQNIREKYATPPDTYHVLSNKVCIVTGGNTGIGLATAKLLAERGAHVILACRNMDRAEQAVQELQSTVTPKPGCLAPTIEAMQVDLCSLPSVLKFCNAFNERHLPLHILLCNAGLMSPMERLVTPDRFEAQFQTNYLSHWLMSYHLVSEQRARRRRAAEQQQPAIRQGASDGTRLVNFSSVMHLAGHLQLNDLNSEQSYSPFLSYSGTKLANIISTKEFQRRFDRHSKEYGRLDSAVAVHPGVVPTSLSHGFFMSQLKHHLPEFVHPAVDAVVVHGLPWVAATPEAAARGVLYAALAPNPEVAGKYTYMGACAKAHEKADDEKVADWLWNYSHKLTGLAEHESLA